MQIPFRRIVFGLHHLYGFVYHLSLMFLKHIYHKKKIHSSWDRQCFVLDLRMDYLIYLRFTYWHHFGLYLNRKKVEEVEERVNSGDLFFE